MLARAILAFLALPVTFGMLVPALLLRGYGSRGDPRPAGAVLAALGLAGLLWCVRDFYVSGRGTLAPWAPPRRLVVAGLYRFVAEPDVPLRPHPRRRDRVVARLAVGRRLRCGPGARVPPARPRVRGAVAGANLPGRLARLRERGTPLAPAPRAPSSSRLASRPSPRPTQSHSSFTVTSSGPQLRDGDPDRPVPSVSRIGLRPRLSVDRAASVPAPQAQTCNGDQGTPSLADAPAAAAARQSMSRTVKRHAGAQGTLCAILKRYVPAGKRACGWPDCLAP